MVMGKNIIKVKFKNEITDWKKSYLNSHCFWFYLLKKKFFFKYTDDKMEGMWLRAWIIKHKLCKSAEYMTTEKKIFSFSKRENFDQSEKSKEL